MPENKEEIKEENKIEPELRAYFFANSYLTGIHAGIQSQHCTAEMFIKYKVNSFKKDILYKWAKDDKTTIVLNGGMSGHLNDIIELIKDNNNIYPWNFFKESDFALNNAITNVGIILPPKIYNYNKMTKEEQNEIHLSEFDFKLVNLLKNKQLMS